MDKELENKIKKNWSGINFYPALDAHEDRRKALEFLRDRITKAIKEVFRDAGYHCRQITLSKEGFSCIGQFSEISFNDLKKIDDYFEDYVMSIGFHNGLMEFKFTKKP